MTTDRHIDRRARHRGVTLVEMLVVVTAASVLLGLVTVVLHTTFRAERKLRDQLALHRTIDRLARQFRADVHAAGSQRQADEGQRLILNLPGQQAAEYRITDTRIIRTLQQNAHVRHREAYALPTGVTAQWESITDDERSVTAIVIIRGSDPKNKAAQRTIRIEATPGRDRRFVQTK